MPMTIDSIIVQDSAHFLGSKTPYARSELVQDDAVSRVIELTEWRVWDSIIASLPAAGANDDLGLVGGTFASASPSIQTGDVKALGTTTRYARVLKSLPLCYVAGQTVTLRVHTGMLTTLSDGAATIDFQVYKSDDAAGIGSDLCATAAQSIKGQPAGTLADLDFTITPTGLSPGDTLDIRMAIAITDAATATAVIGIVGKTELLLDVKG
jgi:hypothetical protein